MRFTINKVSFSSLKERFRRETLALILAVCIVTLLASGAVLAYDAFYARSSDNIRQCYEVLKGVSVDGGWDWWESKRLRIHTGRFRYDVGFLPYSTPVFQLADELDEELSGKKVLIQYCEVPASSARSAVGIEYDGKMYLDPEATMAIWNRRIGIRRAVLFVYILMDLLILLPVTLGILKIERKRTPDKQL